MKKITFEKKLIILSSILIIIFIVSIGYILYVQVIEPKLNDKEYDDIRSQHKNGEIIFQSTDDDENTADDSGKSGENGILPTTMNDDEDGENNADDGGSDEAKTKVPTYENVVGWITIPDTSIDYPVMYRRGDNQFYLTHDYNGYYNSFGSIYLDGNHSLRDRNITIYGHHINSYVNSMFKELVNYENQKFFDEHPIVKLDTGRGDEDWEVVGCLIINVNSNTYSYNNSKFESKDAFVEFAENLYDKSVVKKSGVTFEPEDRIMTLSTCSYHYYNCRTVVLCKKVR